MQVSTVLRTLCRALVAATFAVTATSASAHDDEGGAHPAQKLSPQSFRLLTFNSPVSNVIQVFDLNNNGRVVGQYQIPVGNITGTKAYVWSRQTGVRTLDSTDFAGAAAINDCNEVVGTISTVTGEGEELEATVDAAYWSPTGKRMLLQDLANRPFRVHDATDINTHGHIIGSAVSESDRQTGFFWSRKTGVLLIEGLSPDGVSAPQALNDRDEVVGIHFGALVEGGEPIQRAFIWTQDGGTRDLGSLGGEFSRADDINDKGVVVGTSVTQDGRTLAFSWTTQRGMRALPLAEGSNARGISNSRLIVGFGTIADRVFEPVVWPPGARPFVLTVNDLLDANSAEVVNDLNQIAGQFSSQNGTIAAVWTPKKAGHAPEWKRRICQRRFGVKDP